MRRLLALFIRAVCLAAFAVATLAPYAEAGDQRLAADVDGDGRPDRLTVSAAQPTHLRVWLSTTGRTEILVTRAPILRVAAADVDADHRLDIVVSGTTRGLQIWTRHRRHLRAVPPRSPREADGDWLATPSQLRFHDTESAPEVPVLVQALACGPTLARSLPPPCRLVAHGAHPSLVHAGIGPFAPLAARPPPTRAR